jgi:UDP-N-acetylglucosamine transferase subunit ALG13
VQHGASAIRPRNAECIDFLEYDDFVQLIRDASVVVTHAGVGSVMTALAEGKRPIVVPRRADHGEVVDDHQVPFARRAGELGLVTILDDVDLLAATIREHASDAPALDSGRRSPIETELRAYIEECVGPRKTLIMNEGSTTWS